MNLKYSNKLLAFAALAIAAALIITGLLQGDALDTFQKASRICFECIGIG
jgi:hypothetical protein